MSVIDITNAYVSSRVIFDADSMFEQVRSLDNTATAEVQYELLMSLRRILRRSSRWLLRNRMLKLSVNEIVEHYQSDVINVQNGMDGYLVKGEIKEHNQQAQLWIKQGVDSELANKISRLTSLYSALDISTVATECKVSIDQTAKMYFTLGDRLSLHWFLNQINNQPIDNHWQALARATFREDLDWQQRQLTLQVLSCVCSENKDWKTEGALNDWIESNQISLERWENILNEFKVGSAHEFAKFSVALRELMLLNLNCAANT